MRAGDVERVVAVDWSGDKGPGQKRKLWAAVWTAATEEVRLENGRTRNELRDWLVELAQKTPRMIVGVDFCFSYPAWFVREHGARTAPEFWDIVVERGEDWLGMECADARFWGRAGKLRDGKKPEEFAGEHAHRMLRRADEDCKVQSKILDPEQAAKVRGIAPKSPFQIGGAGAVGTGTLRGIPVLQQLSRSGFAVWPFEVPRMPLIVEIYPRLLTGEVKKSNDAAKSEYLALKTERNEAYRKLSKEVIQKARRSEDAFDALVSVMAMVERRESFLSLEQASDAITLLEGAVWGAGR